MSNIQAKVITALYSNDLVQVVFQIEAKEEAIIEAQQELKAIKKEAKSNSGMAKYVMNKNWIAHSPFHLVRKLDAKKKQIQRLEEQPQKLEVQATDKV